MTIGLIGKKVGMTREFFDSGVSVPVTVLSVEKGRILDVIKKEERGSKKPSISKRLILGLSFSVGI